MSPPWINMLLVVASFGALVGGLRALQTARRMDPEFLRKLLHLGMGLVSLSLPWLFNTPWPVLLLAVIFTLGLVVRRASARCHRLIGGIIDGVCRDSLGDLCFPVAVGILFTFSVSPADPLVFCVPILILTFADAAAALVGTRYGVHRYGGPGRQKSLEGSLAFFAIAFLGTGLPILLLAGAGRVETFLVSLLLALLVTLVEGITPMGLDNLTVPLAACLLLRLLFGREVGFLVICLAVTVGAILLLGFPSSWPTPSLVRDPGGGR